MPSLANALDVTVWARGENTFGELGNGSTTSRSIPGRVLGFGSIRMVAAGSQPFARRG
ncbi:hypothetical protein ACN28S_67840 [Cystobacter fuscus]